jgi:hypothetical protein
MTRHASFGAATGSRNPVFRVRGGSSGDRAARGKDLRTVSGPPAREVDSPSPPEAARNHLGLVGTDRAGAVGVTADSGRRVSAVRATAGP